MLNLLAPLTIEGITVFRDDAEPNKFYPLPDQPVIGLDREGRPEFLFIKYIRDVQELEDDDSKGGGYVQFRCQLTLEEAALGLLLDGLRAVLEDEKAHGGHPHGLEVTSTEPLLAPLPWTKGSVKLLTFGESEDGPVRTAASTGMPDLAGDLAVSQVLDLSPDGAEIFWSSFHSDELPAVLGYELEYVARVPGVRLEIHAEHEEFTQALQSIARPVLWTPAVKRFVPMVLANPVFTNAAFQALRAVHGKKVQPAVPKAKYKEVVRTHVTVTLTSGEAGDADIDQALKTQLTTMATDLLTDALVGDLFDPDVPEELIDSGDEPMQMLKTLEPDETTRFDLVFEQDALVTRTVAPNGPVSLYVPAALRDQAFLELRLTDGFFSVLKVTASADGIDFELDGIAAIVVDVRYEAVDERNPARPVVRRTDDLLLTADKPVDWTRFDLATKAGGGHHGSYEYRTTISYRDGAMRPTVSRWQASSRSNLVINPQALQALRLQLLLTAPPAEVEVARVELRYQGAQGETFTATRGLTQAKPEATWFQPTAELAEDPEHPEYEHRITWTVPGLGELKSAWETSRDKQLYVPGPFARTLTWDLHAGGLAGAVTSILGVFHYEDRSRDYEVRRNFAFGTGSDSLTVDVPVLAGGPEVATIEWTARGEGEDQQGVLRDVAPGPHVVGPQSGDALNVEIFCLGMPFGAELKLVIVRLAYEDAAHGLSEKKTFVFTEDGEKAWSVDRPAGARGDFSYSVDYRMEDGTTRKEVVESTDTDALVLEVPPAP